MPLPNTFEIIARGFARHVLPNGLTNDPVRDAAKALTMNHLLRKGTSSRLTGWAILREDSATLQADLDVPADSGVITGDGRTRFQAFADELETLAGPVVLLTFTKSTVNLSNVFATYDARAVRVCSPVGVETFDFTKVPESDAGVAFRNMHKARLKRAKEREAADAPA